MDRALAQEQVTQGRVTEQFEQEFAAALGVPYAVATTSGSMALLMGMIALGIEAGDEVIVPNQTFIATAHAARMLGARVVLVDTLPDRPVIDPERVAAALTPRTKLIVPVHLGGRAAPMEALIGLARQHGLAVLEDAAQALFSRRGGAVLGTDGDLGIYSLGITKFITTGQGGMVVTRSRELNDRLRLVRNHGVEDVLNERFDRFGFNFKFTDFQAAMGRVQLGRVPQHQASVEAVYREYSAAFSELRFLRPIPIATEAGELPLWVEVLCADRQRLIDHLAGHGIQARRYHPNLDRSPHLGPQGEFSASRVFGREGMMLPSGPGQSIDDVRRVIACLHQFSP